MIFDSVELGKLNIEILDGDRGINYPHKEELYSYGECLFLSADNVTSEGFDFNTTVYISSNKDKVLHNGKLRRNDIVITTRGTLGNVALYDDSIEHENIRINSGMLIIRCHSGIDYRYMYYVLRSSYFQKQIASIKSGSAQPQLPKSHFLKMKVLLPSLVIQQRIADTLTLLDKKIRLNNAINQNLV